MKFTVYRPSWEPLEKTVSDRATEYGVGLNDWCAITALMGPLTLKGEAGKFHWAHSVRVGLLASEIAEMFGYDRKALFFAGLLHDVGKALVPVCTLCATEKWTAEDQANMQQHVTDGFRLLRDRFDFTAHVIVRHHTFQKNAYPAVLPTLLQPFGKETEALMETYGRVLAIADVFDAMHRVNSATGGEELTEEQIRERMLKVDPMVKMIYETGVLRRGQ